MKQSSGQSPFVFSHCEDVHTLPRKALDHEVKLHGGFAVDKRPGQGHIYYGMPGCGVIRISPDHKSWVEPRRSKFPQHEDRPV
jgi:hypothetical protein